MMIYIIKYHFYSNFNVVIGAKCYLKKKYLISAVAWLHQTAPALVRVIN